MIKAPVVLVSLLLGTMVTAQVPRNHDIPLRNWPAPLYWQPSPSGTEAATRGLRLGIHAFQAATLTTGPMVFIAITPCRVVDTRTSQMFPFPFGAPGLTSGAARTFPILLSPQCEVPGTAQAYSFNVTVVPPGALGYLKLYPHGQPEPNAVTLDDLLGTIVNNAVILPAGAPGRRRGCRTEWNTDLVIDMNGYYVPLNLVGLGNGNTALGIGALSSLTTGVSDTAIGQGALGGNTGGSDNTAIGLGTLDNNISGSNNGRGRKFRRRQHN